MSHRHDDADPVEHDPTGMRALLGSLPDPGPMPDRLVARITAALEEESRAAVAGDAHAPRGWTPPPAPGELSAGGLGASTPDDDTVVPLRRRRTWLLGAAAAAVVAVVAGGVVVERLSGGGLQASLGLSQGAADSAAGAAPESAGESGGDTTAADGGQKGDASSAGGAGAAPDWTPSAADPRLGVRILDGSDTTSPSLESVMAELAVPAYAAFPTDSGAPVAASRQTVGRPEGARDCATGLGVPEDTEVVVVLTDVRGSRAAVLVALEAGGVRRGWVVGPTCSSTEPDVLTGPATRP